jgi:hypothetical protein
VSAYQVEVVLSLRPGHVISTMLWIVPAAVLLCVEHIRVKGGGAVIIVLRCDLKQSLEDIFFSSETQQNKLCSLVINTRTAHSLHNGSAYCTIKAKHLQLSRSKLAAES